MKTIRISLYFLMLSSGSLYANNIVVLNTRLVNQDAANDFTFVEFDITWENSWRYAGGPANWDAAWIFVKYRLGNVGEWKHAWLNNTGHTSCTESTIANGFLSPQLPFDANTNPTLGVFLYRSEPGSGIFACDNVRLRWNYGANGVSDDAEIDIRVFALEMVYVPQGSFYVGSGGTESGAFYTYPNTTSPYQITSEAAITVGTTAGNLYYANTSGTSGDQAGPIPAAYPKGFAAFYAMKYELSQKAYVDFLNTLTRAQQVNRVRANITGTTNEYYYVMAAYYTPLARNGINCFNQIPAPPAVVNFTCDYNENIVPNEQGDGLGIPSTFMSLGDITAYLDWAALRLMTEFEFEKCGRGPKTPLPNEYAWGTTVLYKNNNLLNDGFPHEVPAEYYANSPFESGPVRNGAFARQNSTRELSGAGYYGCMELSGNINENVVSVGHVNGRTYTGVHGNGLIATNGSADVINWPTSTGMSVRGGSYAFPEVLQERLSDRTKGSATINPLGDSGLRGVRSAQ